MVRSAVRAPGGKAVGLRMISPPPPPCESGRSPSHLEPQSLNHILHLPPIDFAHSLHVSHHGRYQDLHRRRGARPPPSSPPNSSPEKKSAADIAHHRQQPYLKIDCGLGEGPFWEESSNTLRFLDIIKQKVHTIDLNKGPSSHKTLFDLDISIG